MVYQNEGIAQVYYGDKRIREVYLGKKRIFGSPFLCVVREGMWLLAGGILYRQDANKDNWHISARGVSDIILYFADGFTALKDGNLHFSKETNNKRYLGDAQDSGWNRLWTQFEVFMDNARDYLCIGLDVNGRIKAYTDRSETETITLPDTRFKKPGISVDDQWHSLSAYGHSYSEAVVYSHVKRSSVIAFSGNTYFNKQGEVRIYASGGESRERIVTTLSGTDIKFISDTVFLHGGYIYTISTDSFSKNEVGGFSDAEMFFNIETQNTEGLFGIRDGVLCSPDGSVVSGSPENVVDLCAPGLALTSDYKVYSISTGSAVLYLDLKELTDA